MHIYIYIYIYICIYTYNTDNTYLPLSLLDNNYINYLFIIVIIVVAMIINIFETINSTFDINSKCKYKFKINIYKFYLQYLSTLDQHPNKKLNLMSLINDTHLHK